MATQRKLISAAAKKRTLELYLEHKNRVIPAEILDISINAVRDRLFALNIRKYPQTQFELDYVQGVLSSLDKEIAAEAAAGVNLPERSSEADRVSLDEDIRTLEAFIEYGRYLPTAKALGLSDGGAAKNRLERILGEGNTYPVYAKVVLEKLKKQRIRMAKRKRGGHG